MDVLCHSTRGAVWVSLTRSTLTHKITCWKPVCHSQGTALIKTSHAHLFFYLPINRYNSRNPLSLSRPAVWGARKVDSFQEDLDESLQWYPPMDTQLPSFPPFPFLTRCGEKSKARLHVGLTKYICMVDCFLLDDFIRRHLVYLKPKVILNPVITFGQRLQFGTDASQILH